MRRLIKLFPFLLTLVFTGCLTGCVNLDRSGVYHGDKVLYDADTAIATSYEVIHTFLLWEYRNREVLAGTPEIRKAADELRKTTPRAFASALATRDAYAANPSGAGKDALQAALDTLHVAMMEALKYMTEQPQTTN